MLASARALVGWSDPSVRWRVDGGDWAEERITALSVCNGRFFGGGMLVAPDARMDDGVFDVVVWSGFGIVDFVAKKRMLYDGTHVRLPNTRVLRARTVEVEPVRDARVRLDVDGEAPGTLPARFEILPGALGSGWVSRLAVNGCVLNLRKWSQRSPPAPYPDRARPCRGRTCRAAPAGGGNSSASGAARRAGRREAALRRARRGAVARGRCGRPRRGRARARPSIARTRSRVREVAAPPPASSFAHTRRGDAIARRVLRAIPLRTEPRASPCRRDPALPVEVDPATAPDEAQRNGKLVLGLVFAPDDAAARTGARGTRFTLPVEPRRRRSPARP